MVREKVFKRLEKQVDRLKAKTGFRDTDGDNTAELQQDHADFQGGDAKNVGALDIDSLSTTAPSGVTTVAQFLPSTEVRATDDFSLADDAKQSLVSDHNAEEATICWVSEVDSNRGALFSITGKNSSVIQQAKGDHFRASDTDGFTCVFVDSNDDLVLKNRRGATESFNGSLIFFRA